MCQINFTIQYADADGDTLQAAEGKYRLATSTGAWTSFVIDINDLKTPDITVLGDYDLEVRIQDTGNLWSDWYASSFKVSSDCASSNSYKTALQVNDCSSYSGQGYSVSVMGNGKTIGNQVFMRNTLNSFNGNNNWYRFSPNTSTQDFYPNFNQLLMTDYIVKIDTNGTIIQIDECF